MTTVRERLAGLPTAALSDALDRMGRPGSLPGIGPLTGGNIAGPAYTIRYEPADARPGTVGDFLDDVGPGSVVLIDNAGRTDCTVWGGIMTEVAAARGIAGTVIHGACRDTATIRARGYPMWSSGRFMRTGKDRVRLAEEQGELCIDGVTIAPGDLVRADEDGVVVVPTSLVAEVVDIAAGIHRVESEIVAAVRNGSSLRAARADFGYHQLQRRQP
ncbi:MAG TPA: RraA family protein [Pseudonocardia sp.]